MSAANTTPQLTPGAIRRWLTFGWHTLTANMAISLSYAAIFVAIGMLIQWGLIANGYPLVHYLMVISFLIILPPLLVVYYQIIQSRSLNETVSINTIFKAFGNTPATVWGLIIITGILLLIWITDALIVYTVYFTLDPLTFEKITSNPELHAKAHEFLGFISLMGIILGFISYCITALSIPKAFHEQTGFVDAIVYSIKNIFKHLKVMVAWAALIGISQLVALVFFPPLELLLLPLFAFANYKAYMEVANITSGD